ncbi:IclR family transcriptional regulator [Inquilinus sp. OTU3971]|uniref:IclR family transcriptional regulator n=1 Tax=Inquilinus sp. OTU3971 TaxID=3043855 RepID=UPI00313B689C
MRERRSAPARVEGAPRSGSVQSVERALSLLEALGEDEEGTRLTDLALRTGLSPSTVHRLLTTLEQRRFVQFDPSDGMWHMGRQAFAVGAAFVRQRNFVAPALPFLRRLRDQTRETANLGVADDGEMVCLTQVESREIMRAITRVGGRAPMASSGMGKAILSTYSEADVAAVVARHGLPRLTPQSLTGGAGLAAELARVRAHGYAVDDEEFVTGLRCVAAVVHDAQGEALCAISVSGLATRLTAERAAALGPLLRDTARELTRTLGGHAPDQGAD